MDKYFWLICGLWCGLGGGLAAWFKFRKFVAAGDLTEQEVAAFVRGLVLWILVPSVVLWFIQLSIRGNATPMYLSWPSPQKYCAIALQVFIWAALIRWVFFKGGANTLARFSAVLYAAPGVFRTPAAFKILAVMVVLSGVFAVFLT